MSLRGFIFTLLLMLLLNSPLHENLINKDPWLELEKGLKLCRVENITYQSYCFISENERERIASAGEAHLRNNMPAPPEGSWSMQGGYENGEILLQICGANRKVCRRLLNRFKEITGAPGRTAAQVWSVEAYLSGEHSLKVLGAELISALGGRVQGISAYPKTVQLLAYLPWAGEGVILDNGPVNLNLELYEDDYLKQIRIRMGIPVLLSLSPF